MDGGKLMCEREFGNFLAVSEHRVVAHENGRLRLCPQHVVERRSQVADSTERSRKDFYSARRSRCPDTFERGIVSRKGRAPEHGGTRHACNGVDQQLQPLAAESGFAIRHTREMPARVCKIAKPDSAASGW